MDKKRIYSISFLVCLVLMVNMIPFNLFIENEIIIFIITTIIRLLSIGYIIYYIKKEKLNKIKFNLPRLTSLLLIPLLLLCCSNLVYGLIIADGKFSNLVNVISSESIAFRYNIPKLIMTITSTFLLVTIEELLFRSQILEEFLKKKNNFKAILFSSLIFSSVHLLNISSFSVIPVVLIQVGYTLFLGFVIGFIYIYSKSIILPIIFHFLFNFLNDSLFSVNTTAIAEPNWFTDYYSITILTGVIVAFYIFILMIGGMKKYVTKNMDI